MGHLKTPFLAIAIAVSVMGGSGLAVAQTSTDTPTGSGVAQQFKSGADSVGEGATQIGEGIKQGAIMTWEAIKAGTAAAAAKFNGSQGSSTTNKSPSQ
ncbi:MAG: hypothetical protein ACREED_02385 [Stellaceae bacterium]